MEKQRENQIKYDLFYTVIFLVVEAEDGRLN